MAELSRGPLTGVRVLDLSRILAGPFCTSILSDMGAEVIKVEEPGKGDETRTWGPPFREGESAYFMGVNRGKKSITLNLKAPKGREILLRLAELSDAVVENFRPGVTARLGIDYPALRAVNPRLIYGSVSAYGQTGPDRDRPGFDLIIQAMSGIMSFTGEPEGPPCKVGTAVCDLMGGLWAAYGVALGLFARERTGEGQYIDFSLLDGTIAHLTAWAGSYFMDGRIARRMGSAHPQVYPYQAFRARDGEFVVGVTNEKFWSLFCRVIGAPELEKDPRFADNVRRVENREELLPLLEARIRERTVAEWLEALEREGVPAGPVLDVGQALSHPQVRAREMVVETEHSKLGPWPVVGVPLKFSATPGGVQSAPPVLGEHTEEVLRELLGMEAAEVSRLREEGVL
ncbi:MAG: CaiB/BaiF CoA transferase family protein [Nitrospinota bacterium]